MTWSKLERLAPLTGIAAVVLWIVAVVVIEGGSDPSEGAGAEQYLTYFDDEAGRIFIGSGLFGLGFVAYIWFLGCLRTTLAEAEGGRGRLAAVAMVSGVAQAVLLAAAAAPQISGAIAADEDELSAEAAQSLWWLGDGFFVMATLFLIGLFVATAVVILRTRVFPVWLGWVSILLAIALLIVPIGWAVQIFAAPLWIVLVSILVYRIWSRAAPTEAV